MSRSIEFHLRRSSLEALVRGSASERERERMAAHLLVCETCAQILRVSSDPNWSARPSAVPQAGLAAGQTVVLYESTLKAFLAQGQPIPHPRARDARRGARLHRHSVVSGVVIVPAHANDKPNEASWEISQERVSANGRVSAVTVEFEGNIAIRTDLVLELSVGSWSATAQILDGRARLEVPFTFEPETGGDDQVRVLMRRAAPSIEPLVLRAERPNEDVTSL